MRPTPAEALTGIAAILRGTVAPAVVDAHARAQLHQVITVLVQLSVDDPVGDLEAADEALRALLAACGTWVEAGPGRSGAVAPPVASPPSGRDVDAVTGAHQANRAALEQFIIELRGWRADHGTADSDDLNVAITEHLAGGGRGPST